ETSEGRLLYLDRFRQLRSNIFNVRALTNRIEELTARLQPALKDQGLITLARQREAADELSARIVARARDVDAQLDAVREFVPIPLNTPIALTNWTTRTAAGDVRFTNSPGTLRIQLNGDRSAGAWITTLWLEEGRYRLEGRARTLAAEGSALSESGAVFRVWSHRKETRGASWGWFPYSSRDSSLGGLIPVATNTTQRLTGDTPWTTLIHEFDLRQPLADLQIQCSLHGTLGAAWFDLASLKLCRVSLNVGKTTGKGD
ncbi:MAG: spore coat protein, partial [Verrucomicrobiota bacterium]